jgi:hypothetical protein
MFPGAPPALLLSCDWLVAFLFDRMSRRIPPLRLFGRYTIMQNALMILCVSVSLWRISPCLAARGRLLPRAASAATCHELPEDHFQRPQIRAVELEDFGRRFMERPQDLVSRLDAARGEDDELDAAIARVAMKQTS